MLSIFLTILISVLYVEISTESVAAYDVSNITFPEPDSDYNNSIFIPASYIQEQSMTTGRIITVWNDIILIELIYVIINLCVIIRCWFYFYFKYNL